MRKSLVLILTHLLFSCKNTTESKISKTIPNDNLDTIMAKRPEGYQPYSKEYLSLPIINITLPQTGISAYDLPKKDSIYTLQFDIVGFKNRGKTYPLKIESDGIEIIKRDSIQRTYTFKLIKDTADVTCYIEGQYHNFIYWRNDLSDTTFYLIKNELNIGRTELRVKK